MSNWDISEPAAALHADALVWDNTFPFGAVCGSHAAHVNSLHRMQASGYDCVNLTIASDNENMADAMVKIAHDRQYFRHHADSFVMVETAADVERAKQEGKLAVVFGFQGTLPFERNVGLVEMFYRLGVRQALMAYNQKNHVGDGCHERTDAGLSRFGIEVVQEMNRVGMLVDCTHTGYRTSMDVFEVARGPVIFSHSNSRAVVDHERNIRDDQARACAGTGGVIGVNGIGIFLGDNDISTDALFRHVDYWVQLVGADHVGIGLDFVSELQALVSFVRSKADKYPEGQSYEADIKVVNPEQIPELTEAMLQHGYAEADVRGVLGGNWLRVAGEVWK